MRPLLPALLLATALAAPAAAHTPPVPEDTSSASDMLRKKRKTPYEAVPGTVAEDKQAYKRDGYLDIARVEVFDEDPLKVVVTTYEPIEPDPGGLVLLFTRAGTKKFLYAAYLPEPAEDGTPDEWGLFAASKRNIFEDRIGPATYARDGATMTVTVPRDAIPLDEFLIITRVLSGPDNDSLWSDDAPNDRKGLAIPPMAE